MINLTTKTKLASALLLAFGGNAVAVDSGVTFHDVAADTSKGISYKRLASPGVEGWNTLKRSGVVSMQDMLLGVPTHAAGSPGIAILDFDNDGDQDIYVTNGPGKANSLYSNQLTETGAATFVDVAATAGVELTLNDGTGTCAGDIDNDGDSDLMVVNVGSENHLFENNGNGTFTDIAQSSNTGVDIRYSAGCTMGDANGDGLLDIAIANTYEGWNDRWPLMLPQYAERKEVNQLFINKGNNTFADVTETSGFGNIKAITWGIAFIDIDGDGDADLVTADDQGPQAPAKYGGVDFGYIRIYKNDGAGNYADVTVESGTDQFGAWMGLSFGDVNGDGLLDIFSTNVGDYLAVQLNGILPFKSVPEEWNSAVFVQEADNTFTRMDNGSAGTSTFGWGSSMKDFDNDGDTDMVYYGGLSFGAFVDASNPGSFLINDGTGDFSYDADALSMEHNRRTVKGVASNDLNNDGYPDIVSVSSQNWPAEYPLMPFMDLGGEFDGKAFTMPSMLPADVNDMSKGFVWSGMDPEEGNLSVEISNAESGNNWVKINPVGTVGLTDSSKVNRDGLGAIFSFTAKNGDVTTVPVVSGGNYSSSESTEVIFGMAAETVGVIDVMWPGGVRNKLTVRGSKQTLNFPEIPCSYADTSSTFRDYAKCAWVSLREINQAGAINYGEYLNLGFSAMRAGIDYRNRN